MARVVVDVMLKPEILDPQGRAVKGALTRIGLVGVADVRQGKQFIIDLDGEIDEAVLAQLHELAADLLSNPVIEDYELSVDMTGGGDEHPEHTGTAFGASSDAVVK
ncbi:MAG: phosphoribosylformylglycinamidine synthase subunit PurS [Actinobacteria bacterium]|nr:phosphoribosylformylglycinamidine synthase subunit PurS [Actinomycetota bacterium]